jgi:hypothetical protein
MFPSAGIDTIACRTLAPAVRWIERSKPALFALPIWKSDPDSPHHRALAVELAGVPVEWRRHRSRHYQGCWGIIDRSVVGPRRLATLFLSHRYDGQHALIVNRVA